MKLHMNMKGISKGKAQTYDSELENDPASLAPTRLFVNWQRRNREGIGYDLCYSFAGSDYNPKMGYEQRENFTRVGNRVLYGWLPDEPSKLYQHRFFVEGFTCFQNENGAVQSAAIGPGWMGQTRNFYYLELAYKRYAEQVDEAFELSNDIEIPEGYYTFHGLEATFETPGQHAVYTFGKIQAGQFYDGHGLMMTLGPQWNIVNDFELSAEYIYNWITFPRRDCIFLSHIIRLRALATLSLKFSILAFVQYNNAADVLVSNVRLRYNPREGNDFYLVYDEGTYTERHRYVPVRPRTGNRTILFKYSYAFLF